MTKILCQWELAGYHTLSTVPLGIGRMYGYDQKEVAYEMLNCCYRHFKKRTSSSQVINFWFWQYLPRVSIWHFSHSSIRPSIYFISAKWKLIAVRMPVLLFMLIFIYILYMCWCCCWVYIIMFIIVVSRRPHIK